MITKKQNLFEIVPLPLRNKNIKKNTLGTFQSQMIMNNPNSSESTINNH
jgi:hypothetical protein